MRKINSGLGRQKCNLAVNWRIRPLGKKLQLQFSKTADEDSTESMLEDGSHVASKAWGYRLVCSLELCKSTSVKTFKTISVTLAIPLM